LRHQPITLFVFFATMALTGAMMYYTPKGFFPIQDIGLINGISEGSQDISPEEMKRLQIEIDAVMLKDPAVEGVLSMIGSSFGAQTSNTGRFNVVLKPREERDVDASQVMDRLRPELAKPAWRFTSSPRKTSRSAAASRVPRFSTRFRTPTSANSPNGRTSCSPR
jgi:multidrug efflux pump subunit AcrB